ncbi:MAG: hypothetical protein B1H13_00055 [Desulfobacteraceae bacterium 4484_190.3]|nr:MAG: hypothetical protein B1H13_00055 [Desulfobacteraceae bacterium 4484_190.3]
MQNHSPGNFLRSLAFVATLIIAAVVPAGAAKGEDPHGLQPADTMTFMPHLDGFRNKTYRNYCGQKKQLSEAIVLRKSKIKDSRAVVPAGGLFYISETSDSAAPLARDPFLLLGEHAYLVDLTLSKRVVKGLKVKKGEKVPVGDTGYRMWFDYATDQYQKPYAEFALIAPSGGWPLEFPIASVFHGREELLDLRIGKEGYADQLKKFYLDNEYLYGATRFVAKRIGFKAAEFETVQFPEISEATFSMHRPIVLEVRQEDYRFYFNKRIYAYRRPDGFLIKVTNFTGSKVYAEKMIKPITAQGYKSLISEKDKYHLTIPELDIRIEIMLHPSFLKNSDFVPWSSSKPHGFQRGILNFVIYRQLLTVRDRKPWPLDHRYQVVLEPNMMTGMLQRLLIENVNPITFNNKNDSYTGPVKWSDIWNRPAFKVVARKFDGDVVREEYVRSYLYTRTDNLVFWGEEGRDNLDFFVGSSPVLEPILEDTFLTRLADSSFGVVVEGSRFTTYPRVVSDGSFYEPDHTAPFVPRLKGLMRKIKRNRKKERLLLAESMFIRGSYVDYRNNRIVIPPAGLCYSSRNARNIRALAGESFFMLGKRAYLTSFKSSTFVRRNFNLDFWKNQPMGDGNLMYWQDVLLGVRNKALRYTDHTYLDDRPVAELSLMKYSGNRWGAHLLIAQGLDREGGNRYHMPELFAEGATYIIPEYIGSNYVKIKEFGTPSIEAVSFTYQKPKLVVLGPGEGVKLGSYTLECTSVDTQAMTVSLVLKDGDGKTVASKVLGPLNREMVDLLPQYQVAARAVQFTHEDVQAELDVGKPFQENKARLYLFTEIHLLERDTPFEFDPRFMVRPDVCGHCYQFNEILLDNPEAIILDKNNPMYEGPKGKDGKPLFRIVIDDFDGEMIHAWHVETDYKGRIEKTDNLAFRPRNNIDVLVGVNGTIEGFLRLSMLSRLGFMESWRTSACGSTKKLSGAVNTGGSSHIRR